MKKKVLLVSLLVALLAVVIVGSSLAYFTANDEKKNTFTVGNVKIEIVEEKWDEAVEAEENKDMYPGQTIDKDPVVNNIGKNPAFIRVSVSDLDQFGENAMITYATGGVEGKLGEGWVDGNDGFFYFTKAVDPEAGTTALFETITIPASLENDTTTKDVVVKAYAVQAQGIEAADPANPTLAELQAWFATIMGE